MVKKSEMAVIEKAEGRNRKYSNNNTSVLRKKGTTWGCT